MPLFFTPFSCFLRFVHAGLPVADYEDDIEFTVEELQQFKMMSKLSPFFKVAIDACVAVLDSQPHLLTKLIKQMETASQEGRQHDIQTLRGVVLSYLFEDSVSPFSTYADYRPIRRNQKQSLERGWNHIDTANLLCPLAFHNEFLDNPSSFMDCVQDGSVKITHTHLPSFLYEFGTEYDEDNQSNGLFQGYFLLRAWRHIFTGPRTALDGGIGSKCRARMFRITEVTPRSIAYAAVLARMAISGQDTWSPMDLFFNYKSFYNTIVSFFEKDSDDLWAQDTLEWWNAQIPELSTIADKCKKNKAVINDDEEPIDIQQYLADQRAFHGYQTIKERAKQRKQRYQEIDMGQRNIQQDEQLAEQRQAKEAARGEAEIIARRQAEEAEATARHQAEETARLEAEATARREVAEVAKANARHQAEELARQEAETTARQEVEELARLELEATRRYQAEDAARKRTQLCNSSESELSDPENEPPRKKTRILPTKPPRASKAPNTRSTRKS